MKSILKNRCVNIQRSSSLDAKNSNNDSNNESNNDHIETDKTGTVGKKRAFILDEYGVCRPGELDEDTLMTTHHESRSSVVDRTAAERISYRLVQQRSLDFGLYHKLNNFNIDSNNSQAVQSDSRTLRNNDKELPIVMHEIEKNAHESPADNDDREKNDTFSGSDNNPTDDVDNDDDDDDDDDVGGESELEAEGDNNNPAHDNEFYTSPKIHELCKEFTLKDILGHRVPELEIDSIKDDDDDEQGDNQAPI